jgi:hypothetical protein
MTLETVKFDQVYGKLLKTGLHIDKARVLAKTLIDISTTLSIDINVLLKQVDANGMRFENEVYNQLNKARTNSSQLGFVDASNIPPAILQQVV